MDYLLDFWWEDMRKMTIMIDNVRPNVVKIGPFLTDVASISGFKVMEDMVFRATPLNMPFIEEVKRLKFTVKSLSEKG